MNTYRIKEEKSIVRQEGDNASIIIIVSNELLLTGYDIAFRVENKQGISVMSKTSIAGTLTVLNQQITIPLLPVDTLGHSGVHRWELELTSPLKITIGRGTFTIVPKL